MFENPKLWPALVYGMIGASFLAIAETATTPFWQISAGMVFFVALVCFGATVLVAGGHWLTVLYDNFVRAYTRTRQSVLAEAIRGLSQEQLRVVSQQGELNVEISPSPEGPRRIVQGTSVPVEFVEDEFIPHCSSDRDGHYYLAPIGTWADGRQFYDYGDCRHLAAELTEHLIKIGWALPANGNKPARLTGNKDGYYLIRAFGLHSDL